MPVSRRGFFDVITAGRTGQLSDDFIAAHGHEEEYVAEPTDQRGGGAPPAAPPGGKEIRINLNENPRGPGKAAIAAMLGQLREVGRYPFNSTPLDADLEILIAKVNGGKRENVLIGSGSQEPLSSVPRVFCSPTKPLIQGLPTFGACTGMARKLGAEVKTVLVDKDLKLDLKGIAALAPGAGIVYLCNPNNPTGTIATGQQVADFIAEVRKSAPTAGIVIDEAYADYPTDPSFKSAISLALTTPNVVVGRTFSKAFGMAGSRIGYCMGTAETIKQLARYKMPYGVNTLVIAGAIASLKDTAHLKEEVRLNAEARNFTIKALADLGYKCTDSHTNFIFINVGKTMLPKEFNAGCAKQGVRIGGGYPPLDKEWCRCTIGTMEEMQKTVEVMRNVLRSVTTAGQQQ
jgi:histidinol-phosphate aminotransferase